MVIPGKHDHRFSVLSIRIIRYIHRLAICYNLRMIKRIHTYDLDGVLVDSAHRYKNTNAGTIDLAHWMKNRTPENIALDTLLPHAAQYRDDCLDPFIYVIICTSRVFSVLDVGFIFDRLGAPDKLIMRPIGNVDGDAILKRRQLQRLFNLRQFGKLPRVLWEDNLLNIDALRDLFTQSIYVQSKQGGSK